MRLKLILYIFLLTLFVPLNSYSLSLDGEVQYAVQSKKKIVHKVKQGETISSIMRTYRVSLDNLLKSNKELVGTDLSLTVGQQLEINRKDMGSVTVAEVDHQVKEYISKQSTKKIPKQDTKIYTSTNIYRDTIRVKSSKDTFLINRQGATAEITEPQFTMNEDALRVAMLLPLTDTEGIEDTDFASFYKGAVLALKHLKEDGISLYFNVIDTGTGLETVHTMGMQGSLAGYDLIIGPVYEDQFDVVNSYLLNTDVVLVSPLTEVATHQPNVFQITPSQENRYAKIKPLLEGKYVTFITSESDDYSFMGSMDNFLWGSLNTQMLDIKTPDFDKFFEQEALSLDMPNVIIVSATKRNEIELIMSKIAKLRTSFNYKYKISVVGSPSLGRIAEANRTDFFRTDCHFITNYHVDRLNEAVRELDTQFIDVFGESPTLFSYRAYDVVTLFGAMMSEYGADFKEVMTDELLSLHGVAYYFTDKEGMYTNTEWMLVNYKPNFTITLE